MIVRLLFCIAVFSAAVFSQPPEPLENRLFEQVYLAKDDGTGKPGDAMDEFAVTDVPIHCVVVLSSGETVTVKMDLVVVSVAGVRPETKVVSASYLTKNMEDRVFFTGKPRGNWVHGEYRADIYINGTLVHKLTFRVMPAAGPASSVKRSDPKQSSRTRSASLVKKAKPDNR